MINWLASRRQRPEKGWDPVSADYAARYAAYEYHHLDESPIAELEQWAGSLSGKRILDLGGGPGQYSLAFARRGARVTWHDVSKNYMEIASARAREAGVEIRFSLGYLEEAARYGEGAFDIVFSRICWYYGRGDRLLARVIYHLVRPGGIGYVDSPVFEAAVARLSPAQRLRGYINAWTFWKVGHPFPPRGRIARLFQRYPVRRLFADYSDPARERVIFVRVGSES